MLLRPASGLEKGPLKVLHDASPEAASSSHYHCDSSMNISQCNCVTHTGYTDSPVHHKIIQLDVMKYMEDIKGTNVS